MVCVFSFLLLITFNFSFMKGQIRHTNTQNEKEEKSAMIIID